MGSCAKIRPVTPIVMGGSDLGWGSRVEDQKTQQLLSELNVLQTYAAQFASVVGAAQAAAPDAGIGRDSTGVARAEVNAEGWPTSLEVTADWEREVSPENLGSALLEAYQAARDDHMKAWNERMESTDWKYAAADLDRGRLPKPAESPFVVPTTSGPPPSLNRLVEDVFTELDRSHSQVVEPPPVSAENVSAFSGAVSVVIDGGAFKAISIDASWARKTSPSGINSEIAAALERACGRVASAALEREHAATHRDQLFSDALKILAQLRHERPSS